MKKPRAKLNRKQKRPLIIWSELWDDFDSWYQSSPYENCDSCGHVTRREPDWAEQMAKIEELIEKRLG